VDRLERGEQDAQAYLQAVADATGTEPSVLLDDVAPAVTPAPMRSAMPVAARHHGIRRGIVAWGLAILVVVRFFTEVVHLLPGVTQFVDVPLIIVLVFAAMLVPRDALKPAGPPFSAIGGAFLVVAAVATLSNLERVALPPALLFVYGFGGPFVVYAAVRRIW